MGVRQRVTRLRDGAAAHAAPPLALVPVILTFGGIGYMAAQRITAELAPP
jgi:hypothetical protein